MESYESAGVARMAVTTRRRVMLSLARYPSFLRKSRTPKVVLRPGLVVRTLRAGLRTSRTYISVQYIRRGSILTHS